MRAIVFLSLIGLSVYGAEDCREIHKIDAICQNPMDNNFIVIAVGSSWAILQQAEERLVIDAAGDTKIQVCETEDNKVIPCQVAENSADKLIIQCEDPSDRGEPVLTFDLDKNTQKAQMIDREDGNSFELNCLG